ncbi:hypothetical protein ACS0TY_007683 [Phlomoides rotata]
MRFLCRSCRSTTDLSHGYARGRGRGRGRSFRGRGRGGYYGTEFDTQNDVGGYNEEAPQDHFLL